MSNVEASNVEASNAETGPTPRGASQPVSRRRLLAALVMLASFAVGAGGYLTSMPRAAAQASKVGTPSSGKAGPNAANPDKASPLGDMALGPASAAVTIIEYASMTCPHCAAFTKNVFPKLKSEYIDTGKVHYVFREFPLDEVAFAASVLARCVAKGDPQKFFNIIDVMFATQNEWATNAPLEPLKRIAKQSGLSEADFNTCMNDRTISQGVIATRDYAANQLKVDSTPTFFVNGKRVLGETSLEQFAKLIDPILAHAPASGSAEAPGANKTPAANEAPAAKQ
jgi:protein-disulfide isomerase